MAGPVHQLHHGEATLAEARRQLLGIAHELHTRGWVANHDGNITLRLPGHRLLATPTALSKRVLTESDLIAGYALSRFAQLEVGYGHFFVGDYIKQSLSAPTRGSQDADYVYLQATLNF